MYIPKGFFIGLIIALFIGYLIYKDLGNSSSTDKEKFEKDENYRFAERVKAFLVPVGLFLFFYIVFAIQEGTYQY